LVKTTFSKQVLSKTGLEFLNADDKAVKEAKEINRKNGLPNDFVINGKTFYELPNGDITTENPLETK
jgi:hypothetical protein